MCCLVNSVNRRLAPRSMVSAFVVRPSLIGKPRYPPKNPKRMYFCSFPVPGPCTKLGARHRALQKKTRDDTWTCTFIAKPSLPQSIIVCNSHLFWGGLFVFVHCPMLIVAIQGTPPATFCARLESTEICEVFPKLKFSELGLLGG